MRAVGNKNHYHISQAGILFSMLSTYRYQHINSNNGRILFVLQNEGERMEREEFTLEYGSKLIDAYVQRNACLFIA